mgnify:CR=1 FL=1
MLLKLNIGGMNNGFLNWLNIVKDKNDYKVVEGRG